MFSVSHVCKLEAKGVRNHRRGERGTVSAGEHGIAFHTHTKKKKKQTFFLNCVYVFVQSKDLTYFVLSTESRQTSKHTQLQSNVNFSKITIFILINNLQEFL